MLKRLINSLLIVCVVLGYTSYEEDILVNVQDYTTLSSDNIQTDFEVRENYVK